jgi:hypothetical protein
MRAAGFRAFVELMDYPWDEFLDRAHGSVHD